MSVRLEPLLSFKDLFLNAQRTVVGMFVCSGDTGIAEICAGAGLDFLLIDAEHGAMGLESVQDQLRAIAGYPTLAVVRVPDNNSVLIKQYLDAGAQSIIVPMVNDAAEARTAVAAMHYPPRGIRGVGSSLSRSARWNRTESYLDRAGDLVTVVVQIETAIAVGNALEIASTEGVDGIFIGPADLAASMGLLGQQDHPHVVASVISSIGAVKAAGKFVGVNAFVEADARAYIAAGADFVNVAADVALLARSTEALTAKYIAGTGIATKPASY